MEAGDSRYRDLPQVRGLPAASPDVQKLPDLQWPYVRPGRGAAVTRFAKRRGGGIVVPSRTSSGGQ